MLLPTLTSLHAGRGVGGHQGEAAVGLQHRVHDLVGEVGVRPSRIRRTCSWSVRRRTRTCEVDGHFPNHHPDPSQPKNLQDLIRCLATSDIGSDLRSMVTAIAWHRHPRRRRSSIPIGSSCSCVCCRRSGTNPGAIVIYDVKSTRNLQPGIRREAYSVDVGNGACSSSRR